MKQEIDFKTKSVMVVDNGIFVEIAFRLAREFGTVYYYSTWKNAFPRSNGALIGEGFTEIIRVNNFWDVFDKVDLFVFPDVYDGDLQLYLESVGKRVWGSRKGEELELMRWETKQYFKKLKIPVQPIRKFVGLDKLREYLKENDNKYIKISIYRGDGETWHHDNYKLSEPMLDEMEHKLGVYKSEAEFIVEDAIDGEDVVECGYDGFSIDGQYPKSAVQGYEIKDLGYCGHVKQYKDFSPFVTDYNEIIAETLKKYRYRNFVSSEIRVGSDKVAYPIDPCCRTGSPPSELYQEMITNLAEIVWYGAEGILVEPEFSDQYGIEVMIHSDWADKNWQAIYFPEKLRRFVKLRNVTKIKGIYYIVPQYSGLPEIGAVVAMGNSMEECIEKVKGYAEQITGYRINVQVGSIEAMNETIAKGEKLGIKF